MKKDEKASSRILAAAKNAMPRIVQITSGEGKRYNNDNQSQVFSSPEYFSDPFDEEDSQPWKQEVNQKSRKNLLKTISRLLKPF